MTEFCFHLGPDNFRVVKLAVNRSVDQELSNKYPAIRCHLKQIRGLLMSLLSTQANKVLYQDQVSNIWTDFNFSGQFSGGFIGHSLSSGYSLNIYIKYQIIF